MTEVVRQSLESLAASVDYGLTASARADAVGPRFLRITDIQDDRVDWDQVPFCEATATDESACRLEPGDVVFARTGATTGKSFLVRACPNRAVFASYLIRVRPDRAQVEPRYLAWYFQTPDYWRQISSSASGTAQPGVNASKLKALSVPVPRLAEQRRIADVLDKADGIRRKRKEAVALTEELLRSAFLEMFGDPVMNPKGWPVLRIGDVADVATGGTPSRAHAGYYGGDIPWVKTTEVRDGVIVATEESLTRDGLENSNCRLFPAGSIVVAMYGQGATRGRVAVLGVPATTNQACAVIAPSSRYTTEYMLAFLRMSYGRLRDLGRGGNQPNLNLGMIREFPVPVPPTQLQENFVVFAERLKHLRLSQEKQLASSTSLFRSLARDAFSGNLQAT